MWWYNAHYFYDKRLYNSLFTLRDPLLMDQLYSHLFDILQNFSPPRGFDHEKVVRFKTQFADIISLFPFCDPTKGCELFLMKDKSYLNSDKNHLFLYKEINRKIYYYIEGKKEYLDDKEQKLFFQQKALFNSTEDNLIACDDKEITKAVLDSTAKKDHTFFKREKFINLCGQDRQGNWGAFTYEVCTIPLKPNKAKFPDLYNLMYDQSGKLKDENFIIYAYGLKPTDDSLERGAHPILIYSGTPPDAGQGFLFAQLTDFNKKYSVGEELYLSSQDCIREWAMEATQNGTYPMQVYGKSLGGALAMLTALNMPYLIKFACPFNAPGFYKELFNKPEFSTLRNSFNDKPVPDVYLYLQDYDLVSDCGYFPDEWNATMLYPKKHDLFDLRGFDFKVLGVPLRLGYLSHIRSFANKDGSVALRLDINQENRKPIRQDILRAREKFHHMLYEGSVDKIKKIGEKSVSLTSSSTLFPSTATTSIPQQTQYPSLRLSMRNDISD